VFIVNQIVSWLRDEKIIKENNVKNLAKPLLALLLISPLLLITSSSVWGEKPPDYFVDEAKLPFEALPGATAFWGIHNNAGYRVEVPDNWNGDLLVYTHGLTLGPELMVQEPPIRQYLISHGFAWAASSYNRNDYDVATGAIDTHALTKRFNGLVGRPDRTYVMGNSMGGHIAAVMVEQWPNTYDGAMPCCGTMGDYEHINFFGDFNLVAQALTGVITDYPLPPDYVPEYVVPFIKPNLSLLPELADFWFLIPSPTGEMLIASTEIQSGGVRPVFNQGFILWNFIATDFFFQGGVHEGNWVRAHGVAYDNIDRVYQYDADPALTPDEMFLNETILRVARDPQSVHPNGMANVPVLSGNLKVPVLTLHDLGDMLVPFSMEQYYARRVAANGKSELLVQRAIRDFIHCGFSVEELETGFADLVNWVENSVKPAGDEVLDPVIVADPDYGCAFTNPDRIYPDILGIPPCPD